MIIQHNMSAMNANRMLGVVTSAQSKSTEKLSSGYRINRAADDAAGLSISEKMRAQIRGLNQASSNAEDGISLLQTAEGALNETHSILQRMRELAVQAANGTETDDDREAVQNEIEQLQSEITRISTDTEFNTMKLLDGTQSSSSSSSAGVAYGTVDTKLEGAFITADATGVRVDVSVNAKTGGETAIWSSDGKILTLDLVASKVYTQDEIDALVASAKQEQATKISNPASIKITLNNGTLTAAAAGTAKTTGIETAAGKAATSEAIQIDTTSTGATFMGAQSIKFTANKYGEEYNDMVICFTFTAAAGKEEVKELIAQNYTTINTVSDNGAYEINLCAGKEYSEEDIEALLKEAGLDIDVTLTSGDPTATNTDKLYATVSTATLALSTLDHGTGIGDDDALFGQSAYDSAAGNSGGITLQIGANEGQTMRFSIDDMSAKALGVDGNKINLSTQDGASSAIDIIDDAIKMVSKQRGSIGAIQNRLDHTISNVDTSAENLQSAESRIRDLDMADEMVTYSNNSIIMQAAQSMLAQANQSTQGVLSLLQG